MNAVSDIYELVAIIVEFPQALLSKNVCKYRYLDFRVRQPYLS